VNTNIELGLWTLLSLQLYSFYQQMTQGPNRTSKPWGWDQLEVLKWNAWTALGDLSSDDAGEMCASSYCAPLRPWQCKVPT
jgi:acyl-CoA-binding protein